MKYRVKYLPVTTFLLFVILLFNLTALHAQDKKLYLGYNLWFDNPRQVLSLNNKEGKYLPAGLEVDQIRHKRNKVQFRAVKLDQKYIVVFIPKYHRGITFEQFMDQLFQTKNFQQLTAGFSKMEIDNILSGTVVPGMSKEAVVVAYGPPAQHKTPSLEENTWYYWMRKSARPIAVNFDEDGKVLEEPPLEIEGAVVELDKNKIEKALETTTVDQDPPLITVTDPPLNRGMKPKFNLKSYVIRGTANDPSGVFEVLVNGIEANLKAGGEFWAEILLAVGENNVTVSATD
ncbi:MAG: hypothetical protein P8X42_13470, partial [Calditrichaceae bacterium]